MLDHKLLGAAFVSFLCVYSAQQGGTQVSVGAFELLQNVNIYFFLFSNFKKAIIFTLLTSVPALESGQEDVAIKKKINLTSLLHFVSFLMLETC